MIESPPRTLTTHDEVSIANAMATDSYQLAILRTIAECQMTQVQQMERIAAALERLAPPDTARLRDRYNEVRRRIGEFGYTAPSDDTATIIRQVATMKQLLDEQMFLSSLLFGQGDAPESEAQL